MQRHTHTVISQKLAAALAFHRAEVAEIKTLLALDEAQPSEMADLIKLAGGRSRKVRRGPRRRDRSSNPDVRQPLL
jgi:hypothetical protein